MNAFQTLEQTFLRLPFSKLEQVLENYCDIARECMEEQGEEITDKAVREDAINCFLNNLNDMPREDALAVLADIIADILNQKPKPINHDHEQTIRNRKRVHY